MSSSKDKQPLPLSDTLRDLALLRASDVDLASVLPEKDAATRPDANAEAVQRSYEFAKEARAVLRLQNRGDLAEHGEKVEHVREGLEEVMKGLDAPRATPEHAYKTTMSPVPVSTQIQ